MNPTLAGFIYVSNHYFRKPDSGPLKVLPGFKPGEITAIQVHPAGELEMRVERTNTTWRMVHPLVYPAQTASIENFLKALEHLVPATFLSPDELRDRPNADDEYGFASGQASIMLYRRDERRQIKIGAKTNPGDQFFLQFPLGAQLRADFGVVGAYPKGQRRDMQYGKPGERPAADQCIARVPMPAADPVFGVEGQVCLLWGNR